MLLTAEPSLQPLVSTFLRGGGGCRDPGLGHWAWSVGRIPGAKVGKWIERGMLGFL